MSQQDPAFLQPKTIVAIMSALGLLATVIGFAWWNSLGPFQSKPLVETQDLLANVQYIEPLVSIAEFVDLHEPLQWIASEKERPEYPDWKGPAGPVLTPFIPVPGAKSPREEWERMGYYHDELARPLAEVIRAEGFRVAPSFTSDLQQEHTTKVSPSSYAVIHAVVRTYKNKTTVLFQWKVSLRYDIRTEFTKPTFLATELLIRESQVYAVEEKDALKAMQDVLRHTTREMILFYRNAKVRSLDESRILYPPKEE